jgi:hypothetical protein
MHDIIKDTQSEQNKIRADNLQVGESTEQKGGEVFVLEVAEEILGKVGRSIIYDLPRITPP